MMIYKLLYGYNNIITFDDLITLNYCNNNYNDKFLMMYRVAGKYIYLKSNAF